MAHADPRFCTACGSALLPPVGPRQPPVCSACGRRHFVDPKVGVGAVVRNGQGDLLLVRRGVAPARGLWALPAGYVDAGEDPRRAAEREVAEETGLVVSCRRILDVDPGGGGASFFLAFEATLVGGILAAADDATDAGFFPLDALPELGFVSTLEIVKTLS